MKRFYFFSMLLTILISFGIHATVQAETAGTKTYSQPWTPPSSKTSKTKPYTTMPSYEIKPKSSINKAYPPAKTKSTFEQKSSQQKPGMYNIKPMTPDVGPNDIKMITPVEPRNYNIGAMGGGSCSVAEQTGCSAIQGCYPTSEFGPTCLANGDSTTLCIYMSDCRPGYACAGSPNQRCVLTCQADNDCSENEVCFGADSDAGAGFCLSPCNPNEENICDYGNSCADIGDNADNAVCM